MTEQKNIHDVTENVMKNFLNQPSDIEAMIEEYRRFITGRIKFIMRKRHIGQQQLEALSGVPQSHISRIVTGKLNVTIDNLIRILYCLDASIHFEDDPEKSIGVFWKRELAFKQKCQDYNEWKVERYHRRKAYEKNREKYELRYINSHPTLVASDIKNPFIKQV